MSADRARRTVAEAVAQRRRVLTDPEAKQVLADLGVRVSRTVVVTDAGAAVDAARRLGGPVAMKIVFPDVLHKSTYGGVALSVAGDDAVRAAYDRIVRSVGAAFPAATIDGVSVEPMAAPGVEVIVGAKRDPVFGPTVLFGLGGTLVELFDDVAVRVVPCTPHDLAAMVDEVRASVLLRGYRDAPARDVAAVHGVLDAVAALSTLPGVEAVDVNPVVVHEHGATAVDATIVLCQDEREAA